MGHYSDYYEERDAKEHERKGEIVSRALRDLCNYRQYSAPGKTGTWTFSELGLEKDYEALLDKLKARAYDYGVK